MATKQQIPVVAARLTEFQEEFVNLPTEDAQWAIMNGKEAARLFVEAVANRIKVTTQVVVAILSEIIATVIIPATTEKFVAKDRFKVDTSRKAKVKISYLGDNFESWFMGKTEEPFSGSTIYGRELNKGSVDGPILSELGGQEKSETTLSEVFAMMARQANGKAGELLNNGYANIFYVRDITGTLRAVSVSWSGGGWNVSASSVEDPFEWRVGSRVFSRNSLAPQTA